jgi:hypothetical protein
VRSGISHLRSAPPGSTYTSFTPFLAHTYERAASLIVRSPRVCTTESCACLHDGMGRLARAPRWRPLLALVVISAPARVCASRQLASINVSPGAGTLQAAHDAANAGDTLVLLDGTYTGAHRDGVLRISKNLNVRAQNQGKAIIDGENARRGIYMSAVNPPVSVLQGLKVTRGLANMQEGGGLYFYDGSLTVQDCIISANNAASNAVGGGGLYMYQGSLVLRSTTFVDNKAAMGGCALHVMTGVSHLTSELYDNTFQKGTAACDSNMMIAYAIPTRFKCKALGEWMSPTPFSSPLATFTGCRFKCNPGTYGNSYTLSDAACTSPCTVGHCMEGVVERASALAMLPSLAR